MVFQTNVVVQERKTEMSINPELNALQKEVTRTKILEAGFRIFAEKTIEKVTMTDVANAAGVGVATVYRYYKTKPELVLGIGTWSWEKYMSENDGSIDIERMTAFEQFTFYLDSFLDLYHKHKDLLRFNQFFNVYVQSEDIPFDEMDAYRKMIGSLAERIHAVYQRAMQDHTLRTDIPWNEMFSATIHLMLAVVTRYAVGLVYDGGVDPEKELMLQRNMLIREFTQINTEHFYKGKE